MLVNFILNIMDTFNIIYLWTTLTKKDNNIFKLMSSILIISTLVTITEQLGLNFIILYIIEIIIIKIIYKKDLKNIIFGLILIVLIEMLLQLAFFSIINKFIHDYNIQGFIIESIILIGVVIFSKLNLLNKHIVLKKINNNILIYFISTCVIYVIVFKFVWDHDHSIIENNLFITVIILSTLIISQIFTYLYTAKVIKEREMLKVSNQYNSVINEIVQEIKQRQHDFVNYKNTIRGIVQVVDDKDIKLAINNYMRDEERYDNKINELIYIDNAVVKSIIYMNICKSKMYGVNFQYKIENSVLDNILSYHEISNVLNNLLNNAFDEIMKEQCTKKNIEINICNEKNTSHLIIKNQIVSSKDVNLNEMFTRGYSTKNTTGTRGYGLYNVQQIINSHKGHIEMNVKCGEIIFDIYFSNSSG